MRVVTKEPPNRRLAAILSADVADYTRLMADDETATVMMIKACRERVEVVVEQYRGALIDFVGDNFLAEFPTATEALDCAVAVHRAIHECNDGASSDRRLDFRMGIHVGEIRVEDGRIFGTGVNTAARIENSAEPGGICISRTVREQVSGRPGLAFQDLGECRLKNLPEPVHVFRVHWADAAQEVPNRDGPGAEAPSVAVLPFANMSPDPDQVYFADGMAEELISALTRVEGLRVIARTSAFSFRGTQADIATIGRKLGVSAVVEGSVRRAGDRVRISAQLIDVEGGHHLWSEVYDRSLDDVFQIQDEIARTIVATIKPKLVDQTTTPLVKSGTESPAAYDLYLRAADRLARLDRWDTRTAIAMLEDATRIDAAYSEGWARLGASCCQMEFLFEPDRHWGEQAEQALARAFELDPGNAEAHVAQGRILWTPRQGFQNRAALRCFEEALRRQPGSYDALVWRSFVQYHVGLLDESVEGLTEAIALRPDDVFAMGMMSQPLLFSGRREEAGEYLERALRLDASNVNMHLFHAHYRVSVGDLGGTEQALTHARAIVGDDAMLDATEALLWAKRGEPTRAEDMLARMREHTRSVAHTHHVWHQAAAVHALLGQPSDAVEYLRNAAETGFPNEPLFRNDPDLSCLRDDDEMKALITEVAQQRADLRREFGYG